MFRRAKMVDSATGQVPLNYVILRLGLVICDVILVIVSFYFIIKFFLVDTGMLKIILESYSIIL